jgi:uncharacterized protein
MEPITYMLKPKSQTVESYYPQIARFTNQVLSHARTFIVPIAREFRDYIIRYELEKPRTMEEYVFELLDMGVLWRVYGGGALATDNAPYRLLSFLSEFRKLHPCWKPSVDILRAVLMGAFLKTYNQASIEKQYPAVRDLSRLILWLEATGDFREDALRFIRWHAFLLSQSTRNAGERLRDAVDFAQWFELTSAGSLGEFTPNVEQFINRETQKYRWREDRIACTRTRVEYHLNMVGAEIMNRAFRVSFLPADRKAVLVPGCMRSRPEKECQAIHVSEGLCCKGCDKTCHVNRLRAMGIKNNFDVFILPHASDLSRWASKPGSPSKGVVGVACLTTLIGGGWELKRYGVPAQCVFLNYCGCKKHWDPKGIPTELDMQELKRIFTILPRTGAS